MISDNNHARRHRGSSPPFQEAEQGFRDWVREGKSIDQHFENTSKTQAATLRGNEKGYSLDQKFDSRQTNNPDADQQDNHDVSHWQDDGGESGEVV